jgi:hypothetical protein
LTPKKEAKIPQIKWVIYSLKIIKNGA